MASKLARSDKFATPVGAESFMGRMRFALLTAVTEEDMTDLVRSLMTRAKSGDMGAAKLLLQYIVGSPNVSVENAVFAQSPPVTAVPGSSQKIDAMRRRAAMGAPLDHPGDRCVREGDE